MDKHSIVPPKDSLPLAVRYSGDELTAGIMDLADLVPALSGLCRSVVVTDEILNGGATEAHVYMSAETRASSFEFLLLFLQTFREASQLLGAAKTIADVSSSLFGDNGVVALIRALGGTPRSDIVETELADGSVQVNIKGNSNTVLVVPRHVADLSQRDDIRESLWQAVSPLEHGGIDSVRFAPSRGSVEITSEEVRYFRPPPLIELTEDDPNTGEELVTVVKPSFDAHKRWKLESKEHGVFGARMQDAAFQSRVLRREILFGRGDMLRVKRAVRKYKGKDAEYFILVVYEFIRPPEQLRLG